MNMERTANGGDAALAASPRDVRNGSAFPQGNYLYFVRLCLGSSVRGIASHSFGTQASGKAQPFRTSGGKAAASKPNRRPRIFLRAGYKSRILTAGFILFSLLIAEAGCFLRADSSPFYGRVVVPRAQEFRWSDGGLPQVFDPAFAAAPPDTDAIRALFEGLTDYDPETLKPVPAVATRWESSDDARVWTFYLRDDARWSTGAPVIAQDFVRSWQRTLKLGDLAPHTELLSNIVGAKPGLLSASVVAPATESSTRKTERRGRPGEEHKDFVAGNNRSFGAAALNDHLLRVRLQRPNLNFPALVAHPVFRPVKVAEED